ncbi:unnamed protein product, partial [Didymodactylos carnosus]
GDEKSIVPVDHNIQMRPIIEIDPQSDQDSNLSAQKKKKFLDSFKQARCRMKHRRKQHQNSQKSLENLTDSITKSNYSSSKSTRTLRQSLFSWRNSSVLLPSNGGEQHRTVRRLRRDKRAATSLLILVLVFMIFLLPYVVIVICGRIFKIPLTENTNKIYSIAFWLLWLNSTVNPFLYLFIQPRFKDAYKKLYQRLIHRRFCNKL